MDQNDQNETIITETSTGKHNSRGLKIMAAVFCLTTIASLGGLAFTVINGNSQKDKLNNDLKLSKEEVKKANETIAEFETATGTKAVEVKKDDVTIKEIVKPMAINTKIGEIEEILKRGYVKQTGVNGDGLQIKDSWPTVSFDALYTTNDAKYLVARTGVGHMFEVAKSDREGDTRVERGGGGAIAIFYRAIPNGEWKKAYEGNGIPECNSFSEEIKSIFRGQKDPEGKSILSCWDQNVTENNGIINI